MNNNIFDIHANIYQLKHYYYLLLQVIKIINNVNKVYPDI